MRRRRRRCRLSSQSGMEPHRDPHLETPPPKARQRHGWMARYCSVAHHAPAAAAAVASAALAFFAAVVSRRCFHAVPSFYRHPVSVCARAAAPVENLRLLLNPHRQPTEEAPRVFFLVRSLFKNKSKKCVRVKSALPKRPRGEPSPLTPQRGESPGDTEGMGWIDIYIHARPTRRRAGENAHPSPTTVHDVLSVNPLRCASNERRRGRRRRLILVKEKATEKKKIKVTDDGDE